MINQRGESMKKVFFIGICMCLFFAGRASADDSVSECLKRGACIESESAHAAGGAIISGVATTVANKY
jgi:hypothetical protein